MLEKLNEKLVADWRSCYKWLSMQLAAVMTLVGILLSEYPAVLISTVQMWQQIPVEYRAFLGPVGGVVVLLLIALARLWQQRHPNA